MKCACDDKECKSRIEWDIDGYTFRAIHGYGEEESIGEEILIYYDANALVELIKEARQALIALVEGDKQ